MNTPAGIEELPNGQWVIAGDTHISKWAKEWGTIKCDPALFRMMSGWIKDEKTVWDVGACIGDHTRFYLDEGKQVVAIEPNPVAFQCLAHNCPEAVLHNIAASDGPGVFAFARLDNAGASRIATQGDVMVQAAALDTLGLPPPDFVKIDVEGWEPKALAGMMETLRTCRPLCFVEINSGALGGNGFTRHDVFQVFDELGYSRKPVPHTAAWDDEQYDVLFIPFP